MGTNEITTAAPVHEGTFEELMRVVARQASDPDRSPVIFPATADEFRRISGI